jgi:hypothetical protein
MTAKPLAFKVPCRGPQMEPVGDETTGIIEVPKLGCFTPAEEIAWTNYMMNLGEESFSEAKLNVVTLMLQLRHDREWSRADTEAQIPDFGLVEKLYDFFVNERSRHTPKAQLLRVDGEGAKEIACEYAQKHQAVAVSRADFVAQNVYFVMRSPLEVPVDFETVADYSSPVEVQDLAVGKSRPKK